MISINHKLLNRLNTAFVILLLAWCFYWILLGVTYTYPNAEDLSVSLDPQKKGGFLYSIVLTLITYDGRYFVNVLHAINPLVYHSFMGYQLAAVFALTGLISGLAFVLKAMQLEIKNAYLWLFSFIVVAITLAINTSLPHFLYWMVSSFVYLLPWVFVLFWVGSLLRFESNKKDYKKNFWYTIALFCLIASIGLNEMFLPLVFLLLVLLFIWSWRAKKLKAYLPFILVGFSFIFLFMSSPGIKYRAASFTEQRDLAYFLKNFKYAIIHIVEFVWYSVIDNYPLIPAAVCFYLVAPLKLRSRIAELKLIYLAVFWLILFSMLAPYYYAMGVYDFFPNRIYSTVSFGFVILLMLSMAYLFEKVSLREKLDQIESTRFLPTILIFFTGFCLYFASNYKILRGEYYSNVFTHYEEQMLHRYDKIDYIKSQNLSFSTLILDTIVDPPNTIFHYPDILPNRAAPYWNGAYEEYFNINVVSLTGDSLNGHNQRKYVELPK